MTADQLDRLRALRLHHWCQVMWCRAEAKALEALHTPDLARDLHKSANRHLGFVQTLNYFFDTHKGDTAEKDAAK